MNTLHHQGIVKRWLEKMGSPVSAVLSITMTPEILEQERAQSGKPVAFYETFLFGIFLVPFTVFVLLAVVGVQWGPWIGLLGLIATVPFLITETYLFRLRSFSRTVRNARSVIVFSMLIIVFYFLTIAIKIV